MRTNNTAASFDNGGDMSKTNLSTPFQLTNMRGWSFQSVTAGGATGTIHFDMSNDFGNENTTNIKVTNWTLMPSLDLSVTADGTYSVNVPNQDYKWVRARFVPTAGSGTISARWNAKGF